MNGLHPARLLRSDTLPYVGGAVLVCLLILALAAVTLGHESKGYRERSEVFAQNTTRLLAKHIEGVFDQADSTLRAVAYRHQEEVAQGRLDLARFNAYLSHQHSVSGPITAIRVVDASGMARWGTGDVFAPTDVTDRAYFRQLKDLPPGSAQHPMLVSGPLQLRLAHTWGMVLARRMEAADGTFAGVVYATLHNEVLGELFASVQLGANGAIILRTADMAQIDRYPRSTKLHGEVGNRRVSQTLRDMIQKHPEAGTYAAITTYDQIERYYAYQKVGPYPLYIIVGSATQDFLPSLGPGTYVLLGVCALLMVLTVLGFWHMHRVARWRLRVRVEQQADRILAASPLAMLVLDANDVIRRVNAAAVKLFGHAEQDLVGLQGNTLVAPGQLDGPAHQAKRLPRELFGLRQDGTSVPLRVTRSAIELQGRPHAILVIEDLTRRRQTEARLHELLRFKTVILQQSPYAIVVTDAQDRITLFNPAAERLFGYSASEALHQNAFALLRSSEPTGAPLQPQAQVQEVRYLRKDGSGFMASLSKSVLLDDDGQPAGCLAMVADITELKRAEARLNHLAHYDALTDLPNRLLFSERVHQGLALAQRHGQRLALLFLDLDHFKPINDTWGHAVGDRVLQAVAQRIQACLRAADGVARLGGDEFVVLLMNLHSVADAEQVAEKIRASLTQPLLIDGQEVHIGTSVGMAMYPDHGDTERALMQHADMAMYQAKALGRNRVAVYQPPQQQETPA